VLLLDDLTIGHSKSSKIYNMAVLCLSLHNRRNLSISISHKGEVPDIGLCHLPGPRAGSPYARDPTALTPKGNQPN
jgi:hypothetical protein